jgi:hypothetical protein
MHLKKNGKKSVKTGNAPLAFAFILDPESFSDYLKGARTTGRKAVP